MNKLLPILFFPALLLTGCNNEKQESESLRYSTNTFAVAGGMAVVTQITDHKLNRIYYYELSDTKGLTLKNTVDLTKCGDKNIPFDVLESDQNKSEN